MVQIIPAAQRRPSFGERLNQSLGRGLEMGSQMMQQHQQKQAQIEALQKLGIDPSVLGLPEQGQAEYFKNAFARDKPLNPLQEAQRELALARTKQVGGQQEFFQRLMGGNGKEPTSENMTGQEEAPFDLSTFGNENLNKMAAFAGQPGEAGILGNMAKQQLETQEKQTKQKRSEFESDREYHTKTTAPILKEAESVMKEYPIKKGLINQQRRDIASGQTEGIIPFLVEKTGLDIWRNPESARFKTASKQRFIESLHSLGAAGARANQFIEQQLVGAQAALGRSEEANQTVLDLEEFVDDLKAQRAKYELEAADEDMQKYGYPRNDISRRADKKMEAYVEQRQDEMAYDIRKRHEENLDDDALIKELIVGKVAPDTPLTLRMARILMIKNNDDEKKAQAEAKKLGFRMPTEQTFMRGSS